MLAKFGSHRSSGNGDINSYISSYMNISGKVDFSTSFRDIKRFSESVMPIYNFEVPGHG